MGLKLDRSSTLPGVFTKFERATLAERTHGPSILPVGTRRFPPTSRRGSLVVYHQKLRTPVLVAITMATTCWGMSPAMAATSKPVGNGFYEIRAQHSDKCLDVAHKSQAHRANVIQGTCVGGLNQQWRIVLVSDGRFQIRARHSDMCLDVAHKTMAHAGDVIQGTCSTDRNATNQHWFMNGENTGTIEFRPADQQYVPAERRFIQIRATHSGMCLDVKHRGTAHLTDVVQGTCRPLGAPAGTNQMWRFVPVP